MRKMIRKVLRNNPLMVLFFSLFWATAQAASPLWTMVPAAGSNPTQTTFIGSHQ
ncbi:MAG: hypothetical protein JJT82_04640 [Legionellaceae bacterium]|nr:hypothetical protein [Legionellaceae bacterium]